MKHWLILSPLLLSACLETAPQLSSGTSAPASTAPLVAPMAVSIGGPVTEAGTSLGQVDSDVPLLDFSGQASTVASVGDPVEPGLWMQTPLVAGPARARVTVAATGATVILELKPSEGAAGAGSQLSLEAMRALGLSLTDLAEVQISAPT